MRVSALLFYVAKEVISYSVQSESNYDDYDDDYDDIFFKDFCDGVSECDDQKIDEIFDDVEDAFSDVQDEFLEREKKLNDKTSFGYFVQFTSQSREQAKASRLIDMALDKLESNSDFKHLNIRIKIHKLILQTRAKNWDLITFKIKTSLDIRERST